MTQKDNKAVFFALLKEEDTELSLHEVSKKLGVGVATLHLWLAEFENARDIVTLTDPVAEAKEKLQAESTLFTKHAATPALKINPVTGEVEVHRVTPKDLASQLADFRQRTDGLQVLNAEVQATAFLLTAKIAAKLEDDDLNIAGIASLAGSLSKVQTAFFNQATTNIQVNNNNSNNSSSSLLDIFKDKQRS